MKDREREKRNGEKGWMEGEIVIHTNIETLQQPAYFEFDYIITRSRIHSEEGNG